jgi:hypothetical protein
MAVVSMPPRVADGHRQVLPGRPAQILAFPAPSPRRSPLAAGALRDVDLILSRLRRGSDEHTKLRVLRDRIIAEGRA